MSADLDRGRTEELLAALEAAPDPLCPDCGRGVDPHTLVVDHALGLKNAPRCFPCLVARFGQEPLGFLAHVGDYIRSRPCYRAGWEWASARAGHAPESKPGARWSAEQSRMVDETPRHDAEWDAGEMGCGDLVLELRLRLGRIEPGKVMKVTAHDPGAPEDLPAWCGLTGNTLVSMEHPYYWIRRKEES